MLLVHGRRNYRRCAMIILYSFYKNFVLILPLFYFIFDNGLSGSALYDSWLIMCYNTVYTSIPIVVFGSLD